MIRSRIVADRKPFLLRVDPALLEAVQRWANDDLRSLNAQIEFLLRRALQQSGRDQPEAKKPRRKIDRPSPTASQLIAPPTSPPSSGERCEDGPTDVYL